MLSHHEALTRIKAAKLVAILRHVPTEKLDGVVEALAVLKAKMGLGPEPVPTFMPGDEDGTPDMTPQAESAPEEAPEKPLPNAG